VRSFHACDQLLECQNAPNFIGIDKAHRESLKAIHRIEAAAHQNTIDYRFPPRAETGYIPATLTPANSF
jgi:hypothetical protein